MEEGTPAGADTGQAWFWGDEVPGTGDAPEWLKSDKYQTVADQAKAYPELEKKFGSFVGAPEEYEIPGADTFAKDIDLPEGVDFNLNKDDPLLQAFVPVAKEMGINQEGFNRLVGLYIKQQAADYAADFENAAEQKALLGDSADERIANIDRWAKANMDDDLYGKLAESLTTAASVEAIEYLIGKTRNSSLPNPGDVTPRPAVSKADYDEMMGQKNEKGELKFFVDPVHRKKCEELGKQVFGTAPQREVIG